MEIQWKTFQRGNKYKNPQTQENFEKYFKRTKLKLLKLPKQ